MARPPRRDLVHAVLRRYPRTYAEELGIRRLDVPSGLFQLLVMALLMSARIRASVALGSARALFAEGWTTARAMAGAGWDRRTRTLNVSGYARYDGSTSTMLGDTSALLLDRYAGDLRRLRAEAGDDPATERRLLKQCKGIGDVGVDIFFREVQRSWPELYPFADRRALLAAERLGLGGDVAGLRRLAGDDEFVRLVSGLVRVGLDRSDDEIVALATATAPAG